MKIFWQNMVKISEEKQLTRLAAQSAPPPGYCMSKRWLFTDWLKHGLIITSPVPGSDCVNTIQRGVIPEQTVINAAPALPEQIQKVGLRKHKGLTHPASS